MGKRKYTIGVATVKMAVIYRVGKIRRTFSDKVGFVAEDFGAKDKKELEEALQASYRKTLEEMGNGTPVFDKITVTVTFETLSCDRFLNDTSE